ncbi:hypothetical protein [Mycobacterium simulans]|nr:hypothetical protein [Mycobacterium simulans]
MKRASAIEISVAGCWRSRRLAGKGKPVYTSADAEQLRVDTAGVHAMATRWGAAAGELRATPVPAGLGLSCQPSAAAVNAANAEITTFTTALAARLDTHATRVAEADTRYVANETRSANIVAAVARPTIGT